MEFWKLNQYKHCRLLLLRIYIGRNLDFLFLSGFPSLSFRLPRFSLFCCYLPSKVLYRAISTWSCNIKCSFLNINFPLITESYSYLFNRILGVELLAGISIDTKGLLCSFLSMCVCLCVWLRCLLRINYLTLSTDPYFFWGVSVRGS